MKELLPYVGLAALVVTLVQLLYSRRRDSQGDWKDALKELAAKVEQASNRLIVVETQVAIFFKGISFSSAQALHSPHTPELDTLLEKFQHDQLKDETEIHQLKTLLWDVIKKPDETEFRKKLAQDVLTLIEVRLEIGSKLMDALHQTDEGVHRSLHSFSARIRN